MNYQSLLGDGRACLSFHIGGNCKNNFTLLCWCWRGPINEKQSDATYQCVCVYLCVHLLQVNRGHSIHSVCVHTFLRSSGGNNFLSTRSSSLFQINNSNLSLPLPFPWNVIILQNVYKNKFYYEKILLCNGLVGASRHKLEGALFGLSVIESAGRGKA